MQNQLTVGVPIERFFVENFYQAAMAAQLSRLAHLGGVRALYCKSTLHGTTDVWRSAASTHLHIPAPAKCLLLCSEPELKFVGSPIAGSLRKAGFQPYTHAIKPSHAVPEPNAIRDAAALISRTGCGWVVAAGPAELTNFAKAIAAAATNGDVVKTTTKEEGEHQLICKNASVPLVSVPTAWNFDGASAVHSVWAGPGNSMAFRAHPSSSQAVLFDGFLMGQLSTGPAALRDALSLMTLAAEAALITRVFASPDLLEAATAALQHSVLLVRRILQRGSQPPSDEEREVDNRLASLCCAATGALHAHSALGLAHAIPAVGQQMFRIPYSVSLGALSPHLLDWLYQSLDCETVLEEAEDGEDEEEEDGSHGLTAGASTGLNDGLSGNPFSTQSVGERQRRCRHLHLVSRLLLATCKSVVGGSSNKAVAAIERSAADGEPFHGVWSALFREGIAPGAADECMQVLQPAVRLSPAERELLAATAELHDCALHAPVVPSKQDVATLLGNFIP